MADQKLFKDITTYTGYAMSGYLPYSSDRSITTYKAMRNHPVIAMGIHFTTLGLSDAPRIVECDNEEIAIIVDKMLDPIWKRLLVDSFEHLSYGFKPFEIRYEPGAVKYKLDPNDKKEKSYTGILLKQPRALDPDGVKILTETDGSLKGFQQSWNQAQVLVEDRKCLLVINQMESGNYYGLSILEPVYSSWYIHSINMQFHTRWLERKGTGLFMGRYPAGKTDDGTDNSQIMLDLLDSIMEGTTIALPAGRDKDGNQLWDISIIDPGDKTDAFIAFHEYLDKTMLRGLVIPERALTQGEIGARSSTEAFADLFMQRKQAILDDVVDYINKYLVKNLVELNWGKEYEVNVRAGRISDDSKATAFEVVKKLLDKGEMEIDPEWLVDKTGMPVWMREKPVEPSKVETPVIPEVPEKQTPEISPVAEPEKMSEGIGRNFTARENKYKLNDLDAWMDVRIAQYEKDMGAEIQKSVNRINDYLKNKIGKEDPFKIVSGIDVMSSGMKKISKTFFEEVYDYAYSLYEGSDSADLSESSKFVGFRTSMVVDKLVTDILSAIKYAVSSMLSKDFGTASVLEAVKQAVAPFFTGRIANIGNTEAATLISKARDEYIKDINKMAKSGKTDPGMAVARVQYSAILDNKTCPLCEKLNTLIVEEDSPIRQNYDTPLHYHSRSVWMPISVDEIEDPSVDDTDLTLDPRTGQPYTLDGLTAWLGDVIEHRTFV